MVYTFFGGRISQKRFNSLVHGHSIWLIEFVAGLAYKGLSVCPPVVDYFAVDVTDRLNTVNACMILMYVSFW